MYTKVLADTLSIEGSNMTVSKKHPLESKFKQSYIHYSCFYLGYTILRQLLLRLCHLSRTNNKFVNVNEIMMLTPTNKNTPIFEHISNLELRSIVEQLVNQLDNRRFVDFNTLLESKLEKFEVERTKFNEKIAKQAAINNKQLNKQLKQFVIANHNNKNRTSELRKKKILQIVSEIKFDIIVFDCIEDKYID